MRLPNPVLVAAVAWTVWGASPASAQAVDLTKIPRTIGKEPVYQSKAPKYGLLVFGPEGKDRVWLVLDGQTLYVDRNGNGDLTDPGEKFAAKGDTRGYLRFHVGELSLGGKKHQELQASVKDKGSGVSVSADVEMPGIKGGGIGGRVAFRAETTLAAKPADAPIVHLGGPLQITFEKKPALRVGCASDLQLMVGTPGIGPGTFATILYGDTVPEEAKPVVEVSWPPSQAGQAPIREHHAIKDRC